MTRMHFETLAWNLRQTHPRVTQPYPIESDNYWAATTQWEKAVRAVADACREFNGAFDRERFYMAAGLIVRPDGSLYPTQAPR